ncbi:MAG: hypothetical protein AAGG48_22695 [Planctomycetota bacterium]
MKFFHARSVMGIVFACVGLLTLLGHPTLAHESHLHLQDEQGGSTADGESRSPENESQRTVVTLPLSGPVAEAFQPFAPEVTARVSGPHLIVESNAMPRHGMMTGIRAW